jgi:hypothetical protein
MICCALAALLMTAAAACHSVVKNVWLRKAQWMAVLLAASLVLAGGSALAAHDRDRTTTDDLAAMLMRHICGQHPEPQPSAQSHR